MTSPEIKTEPVSHNGSSQICRLCMSEESLDDVFKDDQLEEWIWEFLAIKISGDDRMSQVVCTICRIRLAEFHQFRMRCHEMQEVLQALISDGTDGTQSLTVATQSGESSTDCQDGGVENDLLDIKDCIIEAIVEEKESDESSQQYSGGAKTSDKSDNATASDENEEKEIDSEQVYQCDICQKICSSSIKLTYHKEFHIRKLRKQAAIDNGTYFKNKNKTSTQCDVCQKKFENRNLMLAHKRRVHGPKTHRCDICDVQYTVRSEMTRHVYTKKHMDKVHEIQRLEVEESADEACAKQEKSINKKNIKDSNLLHDDLFEKYQPNNPNKRDGNEPLKCNVCDMIFSNRWDLATHKKRHKPKKYICHVCGKPCESPSSLKRHLVTHLSIVERQKARPLRDIENAPRPFKCDICKTAYMEKSTLRNHNKKIHGPRNIECEICGFKFPAKDALMSHLQLHASRGHTKEDFRALKQLSQQNDESASIPNENIANDNDNAHEGPATDQLLRCDICQKAFENAALLYRHNRLVHKSKQFKCSVCGKCYAFRSQLNMHIKIHKLNSTESKAAKNFECHECHKIYSSWKSLYQHVRDHHVRNKTIPDQTFACTKCDKKFKTKKKLGGHKCT